MLYTLLWDTVTQNELGQRVNCTEKLDSKLHKNYLQLLIGSTEKETL